MLMIIFLFAPLSLACFPSGQAEMPDLTSTTTVEPSATTTIAATTTQNCERSGFDIYFSLFPLGEIEKDGEMMLTKDAMQMLSEKFVDRFTIGSGPGEARFGAARTYAMHKDVDVFRLGTLNDKKAIKEALMNEVPTYWSIQKNGIAEVGHDVILAEFRNKWLKNRKLYQIVYSVYPQDNRDNRATYNYAQVLRQAKEMDLTTFVISSSDGTANDAAELSGNQSKNVFTIGHVDNVEQTTEQLNRIYERIVSDQTCT